MLHGVSNLDSGRPEKIASHGASWFVLLSAYHLGDQMKDDGMGGACGLYGGGEKCIQGFGGEAWGRGTTLKTRAWTGGLY
jgi:hypothetical protein